ncbi:reversion-inducing cysteine-rich protein with Kazal motifs-like isoform X3 [Penaeus japonicus]|uniref:reversion-inducing cysteine-rich protein with Kazal motifs-like isoform X3 n=1 Tax=Penaeus japonicus TaxID=27405 RepID=UPI001C717640|nr:reversion-inducing cysteine-rich protein with Kazal motifs-like isoform X3 [Penaeus japonicus]
MKDGRNPPHRGSWGSRPWGRVLPLLLLLLFVVAAPATASAAAAAADSASDTPAREDEGDCCSHAPSGCRAACHKVPLWKLGGEEREGQIALLRAACPAHLEPFWRCLNHTLAGASEGAAWWGRPCCRLAVAPRCQVACLRSRDVPELAPACRRSHEIDFYECVQRAEEGAGCCARTQSYRCRASCEAVFAARTPSRRLRHQMTKDCRAHAHVTRCAHSLTRTTPAHRPERNLHCCAESDDASCRAACRSVLTSEAAQQDILEQLEASCGSVDLTNGVWKCLFRHSDSANQHTRQVSRLGRLGLDAAKLGCCRLATSSECGGLCGRAFSREWGRAWDALHTACLARPQEAALAACLAEADAPCQQGCSGMAFCAHFNQRPNALFRSCTPRADDAARKDFTLWQDSLTLTLPGLTAAVPLRGVSECQPEMWRAVACSLHLRPCHARARAHAICWEDCVELLSRCVRAATGGEGASAAGAVCSALSPPPGSPCVSLAPFLVPSAVPNEPPWRVPTFPCRPQPCPPRHVCAVNPECAPGQPCRPYVCTPSCALGEVSSVAEPVGAFVSVPVSSPESARCGRVCECGREGVLQGCRYLPCIDPAACWLGPSKYEHDTEVMIGCSHCMCHAGELTCLPRLPCEQEWQQVLPHNVAIGPGLVSRSLQVDKNVAMREHVTDLPCGCSDHWVPVCATNGRTFPSECLARCAGVEANQWAEGECGEQDVCGRDKCRRGEVCVPAPATCLTPPTTPCPQHICVPLESECPPDAQVPACDARGTQHPSLCHLVRSGASVAHLGNCSSRCSSQGKVCGRDGRTWASECQAAAHFVPVDYWGRCRGVAEGGGSGCPAVSCPTPPREGCVGVASSGWCCGRVCGGGVALTWSTRAVEVAAVALPSRRPLTASALVAALAAHVSVSECEVRGHITLEGHLLVLITPTAARGAFAAHSDSSSGGSSPPSSSSAPPPPLVSRACEVEAERIAGAVMARSPRLLSALPAAALTLAVPAHTSAGPLAPRPPCPLALVLVVVWAWAAARLVVGVS